MALFISRGMPSWVAAVAALAPAARQPQQSAAEEALHPQRPVVALSFRAELTAVLAGMVLAYCDGNREAVG